MVYLLFTYIDNFGPNKKKTDYNFNVDISSKAEIINFKYFIFNRIFNNFYNWR